MFTRPIPSNQQNSKTKRDSLLLQVAPTPNYLFINITFHCKGRVDPDQTGWSSPLLLLLGLQDVNLFRERKTHFHEYAEPCQ